MLIIILACDIKTAPRYGAFPLA